MAARYAARNSRCAASRSTPISSPFCTRVLPATISSHTLEQLPHILVWIVARGINLGLLTRLYFEDEVAANAKNSGLRLVEQPEQRKTLIARRVQGVGANTYVLDITLQGAEETVFFDA